MIRVIQMMTLLALSAMLAMPVASHAAGKKGKSEVVMKVGKKVHLFHSSKLEARKDIAINDVLPVFRSSGKAGHERETGEVKIISYIGDHYLEGEIVKGEIKVGDIAKKDASSLLVLPVK